MLTFLCNKRIFCVVFYSRKFSFTFLPIETISVLKEELSGRMTWHFLIALELFSP